MAEFKDEIELIGKMNTDIDIHYIPKGDFIKFINASNTDIVDGKIDQVMNIEGNVLKQFSLPTGTNICLNGNSSVGADPKNNCIYYFIWNQYNNHCILRFNSDNNTIDKIVWQNANLMFDKGYPILDAKMAETLLIWTDNNIDIQNIDVVRAYNYTNNITVPDIETYAQIGIQELTFIQYPPTLSPTYTYETDLDINSNNLHGALWQFAYRYQYKDNQLSVLSPYSRVELPLGAELVDGTYILETINNRIDLLLNTGSSEVKNIQIFGRSNRINNTDVVDTPIECNDSVWYLIDTVNKYDSEGNKIISDGINYTYKFYNSITGEEGDQPDLQRPYDYVPFKAANIEVFGDNPRVAIANYEEGFDDIDIDLGITQDTHATTAPSILSLTATAFPEYYYQGLYSLPYVTHNYYENGILITTYQYTKLLTASPVNQTYGTRLGIRRDYLGYYFDLSAITVIPKVTYLLTINTPSFTNTYPLRDSETYRFKYIAKAGDTYLDVINGLFLTITKNSNLWQTGINKADYKISTEVINYLGANLLYISILFDGGKPFEEPPYPTIIGTPFLSNYTSHKLGGIVETGIVYGDDADRRSGVYKCNTSKLYLKTLNELNEGLQTQISAPYETWINWEINSLPPDWATWYYIVYTKNTSYSNYFQFYIYGSIKSGETSNTIVIPINQGILDLKKALPKSILSTYVWQKGDRIRFLTYGVPPAIVNPFLGNMIGEYVDKEIIGVDSNNDPVIENFDYSTYHIDKYSLVEIYSPKNELKNQVYYEIAEKYPIVNGYHMGETQNQTASQPAKGILKRGDCYSKLRYTANSNIPLIPIEAPNFSDYYFSSSYDIGRINICLPGTQRKIFQNNIRNGGQMQVGTFTNNIATFDGLDYIPIADKYGEIKSSHVIGDLLEVFQINKITSVLIGKQNLYNADGTPQVVASNLIFGDKRPSDTEWGCTNPESIAWDGANGYFFDINRGAACRRNSNGVHDISDTMSGYFKDKADDMKNPAVKTIIIDGITYTFNNSKIYGYYDKYNEEYVLNFVKIYTQLQGHVKVMESIAYHSPSNSWRRFFEYLNGLNNIVADAFSTVNETLISFLNGNLWIHNNDSAIKNNFYGYQQQESVTFVCNVNPKIIKTFQNIWLDTNKNVWNVNVVIPPCDMYPNGMSSRLLPNNFKEKEGRYYAAFLRDEQTPNVNNAIFNGRDLRGDVMIITLTNNVSSSVSIKCITIMGNKSEIS